MISREPATEEHSTAQPGSPLLVAPVFQRLELSQIDLCLSRWRFPNAEDFQRLQDLIHSVREIRDPVLVSTAIKPGHWVLVDGFKRLRVAQMMGLTHLLVQIAQLDEAHAKAMMLQCNQPRKGLSRLEEALIVRSLHVDHAMMQTKIAELLRRSESWVSRHLALVRDLDEGLQQDVRDGKLSATIACQLSQLQRENQPAVAQAITRHGLSSRDCTRLLEKLRNTHDEQEARDVLNDPRPHIDPDGGGTGRTSGSDPSLSKDGNRLRGVLVRWQRACSQLTDELRRTPADDVRILALLVEDAVTAGTRALRQLETTHSSCSAYLSSAKKGESTSMLSAQ